MSLLHPTGVPGAMLRGLRGRCPHCGEGALFYRYLKVNPHCPVCGHDLAQYPSDDGPAYFTILITGHLVIVPLLVFPVIWKAPLIIALPGDADSARGLHPALPAAGEGGGDRPALWSEDQARRRRSAHRRPV